MLQTSTVAKSTLRLLKNLQAEPLLADTRLVGGTALSLQIGHRESEDLDLFTTDPFDGLQVQSLLIDKYVSSQRNGALFDGLQNDKEGRVSTQAVGNRSQR